MWEELTSTTTTSIAHTIQLALAPVFLLTGLGALLNLFAGRLSRVVDRSRTIEARFAALTDAEHDRAVWELRLLDRRMGVISTAITLGALSAMAICLVVGGLFVARLSGSGFVRTTAVLFILAMTLLVGALALFLYEIRLANRSIRIRNELLERHRKPRG